ncbi:MAG: phosphatase PAP2 family protein [Anaerolineales bacterium]
MNKLEGISKGKKSSINLPDAKRIWIICVVVGALFWLIALGLWWQEGIDEAVLFYFDAPRVAYTPFIALSQWASSYGMAAITSLFVIYRLASFKLKALDAPLTIYFYTICSYGLSGILGDLLKFLFARPRPITTYGNQILVYSQSATPAIPSGHATKSVALILPFLLLVSGSKNIHKIIKIVIVVIASGVCFSRIALGAHYVSDVLAGIGMALIGLPLSMLFANMVLRKASRDQLKRLSIIWTILLVVLTAIFMAL